MEQFYYVGFTLVGIFIGHILSRQQQDKPIIRIDPPRQSAYIEDNLDDPYNRAMLTEQELAEEKRIPTLKD